MHFLERSRSPVLFFLPVWLMISLACNFPMIGRQPAISAKELRQTLSALQSQSQQDQTAVPVAGQTATALPFSGLFTATPPGEPPGASPVPTQASPDLSILYTVRSGDTLPALAERFGVDPGQIVSLEPLSSQGFLPIGQILNIPNNLGDLPYPSALLPDSEVVNSPSAAGFDIAAYISSAGGYLNTFSEDVGGEQLSGAEIIQRVAEGNSINPRLLLSFLEYRSHWVTGQPKASSDLRHPIGFYAPDSVGLFMELLLVAKELNIGYYGWRDGTLTEIKFPDGRSIRASPQLNSGTLALQRLFSKFYKETIWADVLYGPDGFLQLHRQMFGDPWARAAAVEPLFPDNLSQPVLELPFLPGERWSFTGGPHTSWNTGSPWGALDFAPVTGEPPCVVSRAWATASAPGVVTRSENNVVALDLDGDGYEQTGWVLIYLHIANDQHVPAGTVLDQDGRIGHPSCEGGNATGTHVHIARKYNGEWIAADGPLPFVLSGWRVTGGERSYAGSLSKDGQTVIANPGGPRTSIVVR
jgi:LasA protease